MQLEVSKNAKDFKELTFTDDYMFWKVLTTNERLCKRIVEMLIAKPVKRIVFCEAQKTIEMTKDAKGIRLDVYAEGSDEIYNMEMQTTEYKSLPKRSRYYQGMLDLNTIQRGEKYSKLKSSFVIFICTFDPFGKGIPIYTFTNKCKEYNGLELNDGAVKIFVNGKATDAEGDIGELIRYISGHVTGEFAQEIDEAVKKVRESKEWRAQYMTLLQRDRENQLIGKVELLLAFINDGTVTKKEAAEKCGLDEDEFDEMVSEIVAKSDNEQ